MRAAAELISRCDPIGILALITLLLYEMDLKVVQMQP